MPAPAGTGFEPGTAASATKSSSVVIDRTDHRLARAERSERVGRSAAIIHIVYRPRRGRRKWPKGTGAKW
jgi:hypothetical protein